MNNQEYNVLKNFMRQQKDYLSAREGKYPAMDIVNPSIDYQAMAKSMGVPSCRVTRASDIASAIEASLASDGPSLVEIMITTG